MFRLTNFEQVLSEDFDNFDDALKAAQEDLDAAYKDNIVIWDNMRVRAVVYGPRSIDWIDLGK